MNSIRGNDMMGLGAFFGGTDLHKYAQSQQWAKLLASCDGATLRIDTPLHYAMESGAPDDVLLELVRVAPFQVRVRDANGETPVHIGRLLGMGLLVAYVRPPRSRRPGRAGQQIRAHD